MYIYMNLYYMYIYIHIDKHFKKNIIHIHAQTYTYIKVYPCIYHFRSVHSHKATPPEVGLFVSTVTMTWCTETTVNKVYLFFLRALYASFSL